MFTNKNHALFIVTLRTLGVLKKCLVTVLASIVIILRQKYDRPPVLHFGTCSHESPLPLEMFYLVYIYTRTVFALVSRAMIAVYWKSQLVTSKRSCEKLRKSATMVSSVC